MILKLVPPLSGLTHLVMATGCTAYGIARIVFLVPISTYTKLGGFILEIRKSTLVGM
jgi:hypothetical protein